MSASEYNKLSSNSKLIWKCSRFDCAADSDTTISGKLTKLIENFGSLPTKDDFNKLLSGVSELDKKLNALSEKVSVIEPRLAEAEQNITALQNDVANLRSSPQDSSTTESIIAEFNDRNRRAKNVILYKLPESKSNSADAIKAHDLDAINRIFLCLGVSYSNFSLFRIGQRKGHTPRPLKITLPTPDDVRSLFGKFSAETISTAHGELSGLELSRDRTPTERSRLSKLRIEMDDRMKKGEVDLTIKFVNGTPSIVKKPKNG